MISLFLTLQIILALALFAHDVYHDAPIFRLHPSNFYRSNERLQNILFQLYSLLYGFPLALKLLGRLSNEVTTLKIFAAFNGILAVGALLAAIFPAYFGCEPEDRLALRGSDHIVRVPYKKWELMLSHYLLYALIWTCFIMSVVKLITLTKGS